MWANNIDATYDQEEYFYNNKQYCSPWFMKLKHIENVGVFMWTSFIQNQYFLYFLFISSTTNVFWFVLHLKMMEIWLITEFEYVRNKWQWIQNHWSRELDRMLLLLTVFFSLPLFILFGIFWGDDVKNSVDWSILSIKINFDIFFFCSFIL